MQPAKASHDHLVQCIGPLTASRWGGAPLEPMGRLGRRNDGTFEDEKGQRGREKSGRVGKGGAVVGTGFAAKASVAPSPGCLPPLKRWAIDRCAYGTGYCSHGMATDSVHAIDPWDRGASLR